MEEDTPPAWVYNLHDDDTGISRTLDDGLAAQIVSGHSSMLSVVQIDPHSEGDLHSHPEEQWGVLLEGECVRIQDGEEVHMTAGDFWHTPPEAEHTVRTHDQSALVLDIFAPPRPAYQSAGEGFGADGE